MPFRFFLRIYTDTETQYINAKTEQVNESHFFCTWVYYKVTPLKKDARLKYLIEWHQLTTRTETWSFEK